VRSLDYSGVSLLATDVAMSPCPASGPDIGCVRPAAGGFEHRVGSAWEPVVASTVGSITQHSQTVSAQGANYTVKTFITRPAETLAAGRPRTAARVLSSAGPRTVSCVFVGPRRISRTHAEDCRCLDSASGPR
jgi:hypothetical protein